MSENPLLELYVLLVEPSHSQAKFIFKELKKAGINHLDAAIDGESALAAMTHYRPDLVISSMHMPDMTGAELV